MSLPYLPIVLAMSQPESPLGHLFRYTFFASSVTIDLQHLLRLDTLNRQRSCPFILAVLEQTQSFCVSQCLTIIYYLGISHIVTISFSVTIYLLSENLNFYPNWCLLICQSNFFPYLKHFIFYKQRITYSLVNITKLISLNFPVPQDEIMNSHNFYGNSISGTFNIANSPRYVMILILSPFRLL